MKEPWLEQFEQYFGDMQLDPNDAAKFVFATGWNCALQEMLQFLMTAPMERDTKASFAVFLQHRMCLDPTRTGEQSNDH